MNLAAQVEHGAELLRRGGLVAFPTETVYGLGAHALDPSAVRRIFEAKGRPTDNPLIVHLGDAGALNSVVAEITPLAERLVARYWPGPLTLVLAAGRGVPEITRGGLSTIAVRVPDHPVALRLLQTAGIPVAAPSANRSGRPSPTTAAHVRDDLGDAVDFIVDGGACELGVESTVVDARGEQPVVLREGMITREELGVADQDAQSAPRDRAASPGTRYRHYTPRCDVRIAPPGDGRYIAEQLRRDGRRVGLVASGRAPRGVTQIATVHNAEELAGLLYASFREAERLGIDVLVVEAVDDHGVGRAVMDRLRRAAGL